ncbi:3'-5' exonuclease [Enterobacter ludwigii]|uniref:3'-5' exonuclease n=1 Tax=Enterobacter ludwigii TaxID=299767 RepID=UPI003F70C9FE
MNNLMIDLVAVGKDIPSSLCAIEAVFFEPSTGKIGKTFYSTIDIRQTKGQENSIAIDDAFEWMRLDAEKRTSLIAATESENNVLCQLRWFIEDNTQSAPPSLRVWLRDAPVKLVRFKHAIARSGVEWLFDPLVQFRCTRSILDIAGVTGYAPHARRDDAPYTITDARYQAEQVCEIWQRLTSPYFESL